MTTHISGSGGTSRGAEGKDLSVYLAGLLPGPCSALLLEASRLGLEALPCVPDNPAWIKAPQLLGPKATDWEEPQDSVKCPGRCSPSDRTSVPMGAHRMLGGVTNRPAMATQLFIYAVPEWCVHFCELVQHLKIEKLYINYPGLSSKNQKCQPCWVGIPRNRKALDPLIGKHATVLTPTTPVHPTSPVCVTSLSHKGPKRWVGLILSFHVS